jgi:hypothetical protein
MKALKTWFEDAWWSWGNCINFRFDKYEDNIDRLAFFEEICIGYYQEYIYPYDDWYNPTISPERQLRLGQRPKPPSIAMYKGLTGEYVAFVEGGYTICSQPDREKADRCLEYYKSQHPTAEFWGTWEND